MRISHGVSIPPRNCCDNRLRVLDDDHVSSRGHADEFGTKNASAEGVAMGRRDHAVALAPDDRRFSPDAIEPVDKAPLRNRKQEFARHRELSGIADYEPLKEFRIAETRPRGHYLLAEIRIVE